MCRIYIATDEDFLSQESCGVHKGISDTITVNPLGRHSASEPFITVTLSCEKKNNIKEQYYIIYINLSPTRLRF